MGGGCLALACLPAPGSSLQASARGGRAGLRRESPELATCLGPGDRASASLSQLLTSRGTSGPGSPTVAARPSRSQARGLAPVLPLPRGELPGGERPAVWGCGGRDPVSSCLRRRMDTMVAVWRPGPGPPSRAPRFSGTDLSHQRIASLGSSDPSWLPGADGSPQGQVPGGACLPASTPTAPEATSPAATCFREARGPETARRPALGPGPPAVRSCGRTVRAMRAAGARGAESPAPIDSRQLAGPSCRAQGYPSMRPGARRPRPDGLAEATAHGAAGEWMRGAGLTREPDAPAGGRGPSL